MLGDLGSAELATPEHRALARPKPQSMTVSICTAEYRAPDVFLGNFRYAVEVDLWAAGCVAAELWLRRMLFNPRDKQLKPTALLHEHFAFLGAPAPDTLRWLRQLPLWTKHFSAGGEQRQLPLPGPPDLPPLFLVIV